MENYKIECNNVSKRFRWYERSLSIKEGFTRIFNKSSEKYEWYVLKDINLKIKKGERVGIVGNNGSGKTTLLKLFSGIYVPSEGEIKINSDRRLSLIELGVGFYPELTGRENIAVNWALNGLPKKELKDKIERIIKFAGVRKFIDTPLKYYSSGMAARLGFSVAINADPDLLIVDEILAVGDADFQKKCYNAIDKLCNKGVTLVFVSHNEKDVERVCDRAIWIEDGSIKADGDVEEVLGQYRDTVEV